MINWSCIGEGEEEGKSQKYWFHGGVLYSLSASRCIWTSSVCIQCASREEARTGETICRRARLGQEHPTAGRQLTDGLLGKQKCVSATFDSVHRRGMKRPKSRRSGRRKRRNMIQLREWCTERDMRLRQDERDDELHRRSDRPTDRFD